MAGVLHMAFITGPAREIPTIGASGAISGLLGAYLMLYPQARIACLYGLGFYIYVRTSLRAIYFIGLWFVFQLLGALLTQIGASGGVAYWAHVGGFVFGAGLVWPIRTQIRPAPATVRSGREGFLPSGDIREGELARKLQGDIAAGPDSAAMESSLELIRRFPDTQLPFETELQMAEQLERGGQIHLALIGYRHLLRRAGSRDRAAQVYRRLGTLCSRLGRPGQALKHLKTARRMGAAVGEEIAQVEEELKRTDLRIPGTGGERYMLILQTEDALPIPLVSRIIARRTGNSLADTAIRLRAFAGVLLGGLGLTSAQTIAERLQSQRIWVLIMPERLRVQPPPSRLLKRIDITPEGLACLPWLGETFFLPWPQVDLLACGGIRWRHQKIQERVPSASGDLEVISPVQPTTHYDVVTEQGLTWLLDVYGLDPLRHFRLDPQRFDFSSLGDRMTLTRHENFSLFAERLTRAAPNVPVTPGLVRFLAGETEERYIFLDVQHFERYAAWYLTRLRATHLLSGHTSPSPAPLHSST